MGKNIGPISEEMVERTWQEVAGFSLHRADKEMRKLGANQPELLSFVMEFLSAENQEVKEIGLYLFFVVYRIFQKAYGKMGRISAQELIACYEENNKMIELEGRDEHFLEKMARLQFAQQPFVLKYILEALFEAEETIGLTEEQKSFLFICLKVVVDILERKGGRIKK